ncbi:nitrogenase cofactor biosynthesis protein NifB [Parasporobacterium paucivorans]|uniref:FeMo cofactor biosynthesis protein NifB n=1 Tax=Parasporobacterium paucivorans DSM 15970 TaxID=1122934 RepID=A0A1M6IJ26_9FIRM|nr:nitrogenase cofactor biosynthesis protein NifB [Parasporobacterium paucivorans]SHJ34480.1 nitrogenase cofactor biosynthesis protein NifB [Parasporobacterium paucivorans DSM 15970]
MKTKVKPLVSLNVNPCKMCMPMGAVTAMYGIKKSMSILHGSQGCSTYIRRHMATHYNEPVDIASTSLTEHGTVYGGEENLLKGLKNLIELYNPEVIGVSTTCLSETIGEDIARMIEKFYELNPEYAYIRIIPIHSPGYGGTQFDGYFRGLYQIVSHLARECEKNNKINVVTGMQSPSDIRFLKKEFARFGLEAIFLSDLSDNLDGGYSEKYSRLPSGGTSVSEIEQMGGAACTVEFVGMDLEYSPGQYLADRFGVPLKKLMLPVGLRDTDEFYRGLSELSGMKIPEEVELERGRYLDAMIDSHKYSGDGRAVIYGDPDFVLSTVRLCVENGVMPVVAATGSTCKMLKPLLEKEIKPLGDMIFEENYCIVDDIDFKTMEELAVSGNANLMIGNSDGRRIEENMSIPLVRRGFPIHDRVGGQRLRMLGFAGSLMYLDEITNAVLACKERGFRKELYNEYYKDTPIDQGIREEVLDTAAIKKREIEEKTKTHPCYNCGAHEYARIHLPVAPHCNVQCNYCVRKFDCPNESRPGVTTKVMTPEEAFDRYISVKEKVPNLSVVGIAGPGDALANFGDTKRTLELIREYDPKVTFCLSTNGLMLPKYADELIKLGVSHVTVTINAVDPRISAKIYKFIDYMGIRFTGENAGAILLSNQLNGIRLLASQGIICKVNIVTLKGINDTHIPEVVSKMKSLGCYVTNIMPMIPVKGSAFENLVPASNKEVNAIRDICGETMLQMYHCRQCRADAVGRLDNDISLEVNEKQQGEPAEQSRDQEQSARFAVASKSGTLVDQHFGQIQEVYIYESKNDEVRFVERRKIDQYCTGAENCDHKEGKIDSIISMIEDCKGVIAMRIGEEPRNKLTEKGIFVYPTYDRIEDAVKKATSMI